MVERNCCRHPDGCPRPAAGPIGGKCDGWCAMHLLRMRKYGSPGDVVPQRFRGAYADGRPKCRHPDGCPLPARRNGWCNTHSERLKRTSDPGPVGRITRKPGLGGQSKLVQMRWQKYGLMPDDYDRMASAQQGLCFLCGRKAKLYVDHDHVTGRVRRLLCPTCNVGIGHLGDDPARLRAAADYIESHRRGLP